MVKAINDGCGSKASLWEVTLNMNYAPNICFLLCSTLILLIVRVETVIVV